MKPLKKCFSLLLLMICSATLACGQIELRAGSGFPTYPTIKEIDHGMCDCGDDYRALATLYLDAWFPAKDRVRLGMSYIFEYQKHYTYSDMPGYDYHGTNRTIYQTLLFNISYSWLSGKWVRLYTYGGAGIFVSAKDPLTAMKMPSTEKTQTKGGLGYQLSPIGISFGKKISGFFELGFGYKGMLTGGISYRFK